MAGPRGCCRYSGVCVKSFERDHRFLGCDRAPSKKRVGSTVAGVVILLTHLIQELYESLQIGLLQALDIWPQAFVAEKFQKGLSVVGICGVELLKLLSDTRSRRCHIRSDRQHRCARVCPLVRVHLGGYWSEAWWGVASEGTGYVSGGQMAATTNPHGL